MVAPGAWINGDVKKAYWLPEMFGKLRHCRLTMALVMKVGWC